MSAVKCWVMEGTQGRILFVDNDSDTCEMVRTLLGNAGYETVTASSVTDGLLLARTDTFDLVLLDWHFQDGTGIELCRMIRTFDDKTPIFFYTGMASEEDGNTMRRAGAQGCFVKPVEVESLLKTLSLYVRGGGGVL